MQNARGTRDSFGNTALAQQQIVSTLKGVFERYGFNPLQTPVLERLDTLTSKYAGGEEILKEIFKLTDQGKREIGLRYDLTVPLARFIASNTNLRMPFKRYAIGSVFRDGPLKIGRYREFIQCDVDTVGVAGISADAEIIQLAFDSFKKLGLNVRIKINSRKIMDSILEIAGIEEKNRNTTILSIDKLEKFGKASVVKELAAKGINNNSIQKILTYLSTKGTNASKLESLKGLAGIDEMSELLKLVPNADFEPSLARGLAYYTGSVFEVFLKDSDIKSSVAGGGRYDKMIGNFVGNNRDYPAVGISFGLDVISDAWTPNAIKSVVKVLVISIGQDNLAFETAKLLRSKGINSDIDFSGKVRKAIEFANYYKIPFAIFIGEKEAEKGMLTLRDMNSGKEKIEGTLNIITRLK